MQIGEFIFNNLQVIVAVGGGICAFFLIKGKKYKHSNNDITPLILKLNKQKDALSKRSKSIIS